MERVTIEGDSHVSEKIVSLRQAPKYHGTRGILWEFGRTIF